MGLSLEPLALRPHRHGAMDCRRASSSTASTTTGVTAKFREPAGFRRQRSRGMAEVWVPGQFMIGTLLMLFFGLPSMTRSL